MRGEMKLSGCSPEQALGRILKRRDAVIEAEQQDPLRCGWEPSIWLVPRALLDWQWCSRAWEAQIKKRLGMTWEEFKAAMRKRLGFEEPVKMVLLLGGQRSGKSECEAKMALEMTANKPKSTVVAMHMSEKRSINEQQPLFRKYMPPEWPAQIQTAGAYIKYKLKTGFSEGSFITPILSQGRFINYTQDLDIALQGLELDFVTPDELVPPDWIENLTFRLSTRSGKGLVGFTPIHGYTPSVQIFLEGAMMVMERTAYLCPKDGGPRLEAATLGVTDGELEELWNAERNKPPRAARAPQSRPEDVLAWLGEGNSREKAQEAQKGNNRKFELLPRVMKCTDPRKAVVFFWSDDNPYGNPKEVAADVRVRTAGGSYGVRERYYGIPDRVKAGKFPKFSRKVNVIPASAVPTQGLDYLFMDPASGRNAYMLWIRVLAGKVYARREWPGPYWIPGKGMPGPWAIPCGRKQGQNDGARGEGQEPMGFGTIRMKFEIARLERWKAHEDWRAQVRDHASVDPRDIIPSLEEIEEWEESSEDIERMEARYIDSRAASAPRMERDRPVTLLTDYERIGLDFDLAPGNEIADGIDRINSMLDYVTESGDPEGKNWLTAPRFFVSADCPNLIYTMENWKWVDGENGACKDPADLVRYVFDLDLQNATGSATRERSRGGFSYGRRRIGRGRDPRTKILPPATVDGEPCRI